MKISLISCGSRGDVQPMLALALGLRKAGHETIFCAPPEYRAMVEGRGCVFTALGAGIKGNPTLAGGSLRGFGELIRQELVTQIDQLPEIVSGSDVLLGTGLVLGVPTVGELLGIPCRFVAFSPATMLGTNRDSLGVKFLGWMVGKLANASYRGALNQKRRELGLKPIQDVLSHWMGDRAIAATDAALTYLPEGAVLKTTQTGYPYLPQDSVLGDEIEGFLAAGPPPVYVGFGSMPVGDVEKVSRLLTAVAKTADQRLVISSGWAGLKPVESCSDCLFVEDVPHEPLFRRVAAVVHHGGAGTVATAARAGVPQVVVPQAADQFEWRKQVTKLGLGPRASIFKMLSAKGLAKAIRECTSNELYRRRARDVAERLKDADGVALTVKVIEDDLRRRATAAAGAN